MTPTHLAEPLRRLLPEHVRAERKEPQMVDSRVEVFAPTLCAVEAIIHDQFRQRRGPGGRARGTRHLAPMRSERRQARGQFATAAISADTAPAGARIRNPPLFVRGLYADRASADDTRRCHRAPSDCPLHGIDQGCTFLVRGVPRSPPLPPPVGKNAPNGPFEPGRLPPKLLMLRDDGDGGR